MINAGTVSVKLFADVKQFQAGMAGASASVGKMTKSIGTFAKMSIFAFAAITAASVKMAGDFDKRLREISTLLIGVTEKDIKNMSLEIRNLSKVTGLALDDLGKAKYDIISAGFTNAAESAQLLNTSARLAVGGVTSARNAADLLTSALNSFQKSGLDAEWAADILFTTVRLGKTTMDELTGSVGRVFPTAKALGASLEDVGAAMATITAGGIKTYEAATYLNQAFTKLGAPSSIAEKYMHKYSIQVFRTNDGMLDLLKTIKQFQGYDLKSMRKFFPEIRAIKAILAMTNNIKFLERALNDVYNATGATDVAFAKMSDAFTTKVNKTVAQIKSIMISFGDMLLPFISQGLFKIQKYFDNNQAAILKTLSKIANGIIILFKNIDKIPEKLFILFAALSILTGNYLAGAIFGMGALITFVDRALNDSSTKVHKGASWVLDAYINTVAAIHAAFTALAMTISNPFIAGKEYASGFIKYITQSFENFGLNLSKMLMKIGEMLVQVTTRFANVFKSKDNKLPIKSMKDMADELNGIMTDPSGADWGAIFDEIEGRLAKLPKFGDEFTKAFDVEKILAQVRLLAKSGGAGGGKGGDGDTPSWLEPAAISDYIANLAVDLEGYFEKLDAWEKILLEIKMRYSEIGATSKSVLNTTENMLSGIEGSFSEMFSNIMLSGRVAADELSKYNEGLTDDYRTQNQIIEDSFSSLWDKILQNVVDTVAAIVAEIVGLFAVYTILNAITGGNLGAIISGGDKAGKFFQGLEGWFTGDGGDRTGFAAVAIDLLLEGLKNIFKGDSISDGVITPSGQVVHTAPDDYIMAMKDPASFGKNAGGGGDTYNITALDSQSFDEYLKRNKGILSRNIGNNINSRDLIISTSGQNARASY